jgi:transposase
MSWELAGSQKGKLYGQRAQVETGMSMIKRNLSDALRSRSAAARRHEMLFRVLVHNIML